MLLEDQQLDRDVHLLVNAPACLEKPHECLAGVEVRTTGVDWPISVENWSVKVFFFLLANVTFKFLPTVSLVQQGQILCQVPSLQCNEPGLFWKFSFHHFFILQPPARCWQLWHLPTNPPPPSCVLGLCFLMCYLFPVNALVHLLLLMTCFSPLNNFFLMLISWSTYHLLMDS